MDQRAASPGQQPARKPQATRLDGAEDPGRRASATRLDPTSLSPTSGRPGRTRVETPTASVPAPHPGATRIDGSTDATPPTTSATGYVRRPFPPSLAERLLQKEEIGEGGEALVYHAQYRRGSRREAVVKLFHSAPTYAFALDDPEYRRHFRPEHTVGILERGDEGGQYWEVEEYCPEGSLQDSVGTHTFTTAELTEIIRELTCAIASMHPYVHGDIKPSNVLVRSRRPKLDLVLTDFGITVDLGGRSRKTNTGRGTVAYLPPGGRDAIRPENDWWAMGMTVLDLILGHNVFQDDRGRWLDDSRIGEFLATDAVPLDGVDDPRLRMLLKGLLQRSHHQRWGEHEVLEWCSGGSPAVARDAGTMPPTGMAPSPAQAATARTAASPLSSTSRATGPFPFDGTAHYVPAELGRAMQSSPHAAKVGRGVELSNLDEWLRPFACHDQVARVIRQAGKLGPQLTADLVAALIQPEGHPVYQRCNLSSEPDLLGAVDSFTAEQMKDLYALRPMYYFSSLLDLPALGLLDERWRDLIDQARVAAPDQVRGKLPEDTLHRLALAAALRGDSAGAALAKQAAAARDALPARGSTVDWLGLMGAPRADSPGTSLALLALAPLANEVAQKVALDQAAARERARQQEISRLSAQIASLEQANARARPAPFRFRMATVVGPLGTATGVTVAMTVLLLIAMVVYSVVSISRIVPDGNLMAEAVAEHFFPEYMHSSPSGVGEAVGLLLSTIYLRMFGLAAAVAIAIDESVERTFGAPRRSWPTTLVVLGMLAMTIRPWAIAAGGQFPFTTSLDAYFLIPSAAYISKTACALVWGARKPQIAQIASNDLEIATARSKLAALQAR